MKLKGKASICMALLLSAVAILSACGNSKENSSQVSTAAAGMSQVETVTDGDGRELVGNVYREGLPLVKETISYTTLVSTSPYLKTPAKDLEMWKELEERTGVHLELEEIPNSNYNEKVNLMISSNDLPDIFLKSIGEITSKYYNTGLFLPLEDMIEQWAPNLQTVLSDPTSYANLSATDGHIYATPQGELAPWVDIMDQLFINTVWLENLNLEMPTTLEEYYEVLKAFKTQDPNKNGLNDELPFTVRMERGGNNIVTFMSNFGLPIDQNYAMLKEDTYVFGPMETAFREGLAYMHRLYAEGLMDAESLTQGMAEMQAKGSGAYQLIGSTVNFWLDDYCTGEGTLDYFSVPPFANEEGEAVWFRSTNVPSAIGISVSAACENPEAIIRWADYLSETPYRAYEVNYGPESLGVFTTTQDNKVRMNADAVPGGITFEEWTRSVTIRDLVPTIVSQEGVLEGRVVDAAPERKLSYMESYMPFIYPTVLTNGHIKFYESEEVEQEALTIWTDIQPLVENFMAESIINGVDDVSWNKFHDTLKSARLDRYLEIRQASIDEFLKTTK